MGRESSSGEWARSGAAYTNGLEGRRPWRGTGERKFSGNIAGEFSGSRQRESKLGEEVG
jgi:hypothetical protein